jgi:hypothetical protein
MTAKVSDPRAVRCHNVFRYLSFALLIVYFIYYVEWTERARVQLTMNAWLQNGDAMQTSEVSMCDNPDYDYFYAAGEFCRYIVTTNFVSLHLLSPPQTTKPS